MATWIGALVGLASGLAVVLAFSWSEREQSRVSPEPPPLVPPGVNAVLSVLRSSAVVLDESDRVVKTSAAAHSFGMVRGDRLVPDELLQMARQVRRDGEIRQAELDLPRGPFGNETLAVSARVAPLGTQLVLVLVEDRTETRRVDAVRRDFVANVSHELKTPVGALSLLAEAVLDASDDPEAIRRFAGRMQYEASRLSGLVQELIDLSRLQGDNPLEKAKAVGVDDLLNEAVDRSRALAGARGIELITGGEQELQVFGNEQQLLMALGNLVENAVNYSPSHTRVALGTRRYGDVVEISVSDQGIGIPERDLERIFERFYRVDQARSRATGGTGLGLSIVKHVAANHGGEVSVWSVEGSGSTFTLRLPLVVPRASTAGVEHASTELAPTPVQEATS